MANQSTSLKNYCEPHCRPKRRRKFMACCHCSVDFDWRKIRWFWLFVGKLWTAATATQFLLVGLMEPVLIDWLNYLLAFRVTCTLSYFTLILYIAQMAGNPFLNFFIQSAAEAPAFILGNYMGKCVCLCVLVGDAIGWEILVLNQKEDGRQFPCSHQFGFNLIPLSAPISHRQYAWTTSHQFIVLLLRSCVLHTNVILS